MTEMLPETAVETLRLLDKCSTVTELAQKLGIGYSAARKRVERARKMYRDGVIDLDSDKVDLPQFPDDDIPTEEIIASMEQRFSKRHAHSQAKRWFPIKVKIDGPFGIMWYGDPHLDNNGCNWPLLRKHIELHKKCPQLLAANLGDTTDNWVGRLMRLYAESDQSRGTAYRLTRWFLIESGIPWFLWIDGNHCKWNEFVEWLRAINANKIFMDDRAQFVLRSPCGKEWKIWAEHNFKGHSMWNSLHGPQKAAHMKDMAHLYINGHTHNWALHQEESASREFTYWLARARGYKFIDHYAEELGHFPQAEGASIVSVHDPNATSMAGFLTCFADPEEATDYLIWKRKRK